MHLESVSLNGINSMSADYAQLKGITSRQINKSMASMDGASNGVGSFSQHLSATGAPMQSTESPISADEATKMAAQFESLFYSMLLKEMRNTISMDGEGGLFPGENSDTLGGMFDLYLGQHLADSHRLGIGDAIKSYLAASST